MSTNDTLLDSIEPLFVVYEYPKKIRHGLGGFVIADVDTPYDCLISAGIERSDDFLVDFIQKHKLQTSQCFGFVATNWRLFKGKIKNLFPVASKNGLFLLYTDCNKN